MNVVDASGRIIVRGPSVSSIVGNVRFEVETDRVLTLVSRARELLTQISDNRQQMFQAVEELNGMWVGEAHDVFVTRCGEDNTEMQTLVTELQAVVEKFTEARTAYERCERSAVEKISALQI